MHARIVRFTGVTPEQVDKIIAQVEEADGPPPGVDSTGLQLWFDADQGTAVFVGAFEDAEKMAAADAVFDAMDPGDTPGTRASVDRAELKMNRDG
jgi:hypothetical protein